MNSAQRMMRLAVAAAAMAALPGMAFTQQQDFSKVQIASQPLTDQLYLLTGAGSVLVAHANTRSRMSTRQFVDLFKSEVLPASPAALPIVTFEPGVTLHLNGETINARHVAAAHTDSDVVLYFETSNVVHAGDVFITPAYPFADLSSGGRINGLILALDDILARTNAQTRVIPGHGPLSTRADVQAYRDMLVVVRDRVARALRAGRSQQQVLDARPSREFDQRFGGSFITAETFVPRTNQDLARE